MLWTQQKYFKPCWTSLNLVKRSSACLEEKPEVSCFLPRVEPDQAAAAAAGLTLSTLEVVGIDLAVSVRSDLCQHWERKWGKGFDNNLTLWSHSSPHAQLMMFYFRMRNLFLLTALAISLSLADAQDGGFFGGITNAFNSFFGGGNPRPQPQRRPPQQFQQQQFQQQQQQQFFQPQPQSFQPQQQQQQPQFRPRPAQGSFQQAPVFQPQPAQPVAQQPQVIRQPQAAPAFQQPAQNRWGRRGEGRGHC